MGCRLQGCGIKQRDQAAVETKQMTRYVRIPSSVLNHNEEVGG
jgi:hypothetical protein